MGNLRNMLAITGKELRILLTDRGTLMILFLMPLLFGLMLSNLNVQMSDEAEEESAAVIFPVYVVNEDNGPFGEQVVDALSDMEMLDITFESSRAEADDSVRQGEKLAAVVIPAGFSDNINAYEPTTVDVIVDPLQEEYASFVTGLTGFAVTGPTVIGEIQFGVHSIMEESGVLEGAPPDLARAAEAQSVGAIMTQLQAMQADPAIVVKTETTAAEEDGGWSPSDIFIFFMSAFAVMFSFFLVGIIGQSLHRERDHGSFRRLLAAPLSRASIISGNSLAYMIFVALQVIFLYGFSAVAFGMPLGDRLWLLVLITIVLGVVVATMGLMIAALTRSVKQADNVGMMLGFVLAGLGGGIPVGPALYEQEGFLGLVSKLTPHAHAIYGYRMIMGDSGTIGDVLLQIGILALFAVAFFVVASWRLKWE